MPAQIFLVEDHPAMRSAYEALLARAPDVVLAGTAETAEDALEHLERGERWDLLITDVSLPGMDGVDFASHVLASSPQLPVLVVSVDEGHRPRAEAAGVTGFLSKDGLAKTLLPTVRDLVSQHPQQGRGTR